MQTIPLNPVTSKTKGTPRSGKWPTVRDRFLQGKRCAVCGGKTKLEAHHIVPFHEDPALELDPANLIPLCEGRKTIICHLIIGHGGDYRDINPSCRKDAEHLHVLLTTRQMHS